MATDEWTCSAQLLALQGWGDNDGSPIGSVGGDMLVTHGAVYVCAIKPLPRNLGIDCHQITIRSAPQAQRTDERLRGVGVRARHHRQV